jgi:hypothetical protein
MHDHTQHRVVEPRDDMSLADEGATIAVYGVAVAFVAILAGAGLLIFGETIGDWFASLVDTLGI